MRDLMDRAGRDPLAFTSADFFQFATNFATDVQVWERPVVCVVPREGEPFVLLNELSANHWRCGAEDGRLWVSDVSYYAEHPRLGSRLPLLELGEQDLHDAGEFAPLGLGEVVESRHLRRVPGPRGGGKGRRGSA